MAIFGVLKTTKPIKVIGWSFCTAIILYLTVALAFYQFQDKIIFQGQSLPKDYTFTFHEEFVEHFIKTEDGETLNALLFKTQQPSKGLILYFHGNADNLQRWGEYAVDLTSLGYDVLMPDYRGYGKSTGKPTETNLYDDAATILRWSQTHLVATRLIFYGRSLGSAVATHLATTAQPDLLILETPFDELAATVYTPMRPILSVFPLRYKFPNKTFLKEVACKKIIFHGTEDWVVPISSALRLKPLLGKNDQFVIIEGGGHRNLREFEIFHKILADALN